MSSGKPNEKPSVRFTLDIFKDIKELRKNNTTRDFEVDTRSYEANKKKKMLRNSRSAGVEGAGESQQPPPHKMTSNISAASSSSQQEDRQQKRQTVVPDVVPVQKDKN